MKVEAEKRRGKGEVQYVPAKNGHRWAISPWPSSVRVVLEVSYVEHSVLFMGDAYESLRYGLFGDLYGRPQRAYQVAWKAANQYVIQGHEQLIAFLLQARGNGIAEAVVEAYHWHLLMRTEVEVQAEVVTDAPRLPAPPPPRLELKPYGS